MKGRPLVGLDVTELLQLRQLMLKGTHLDGPFERRLKAFTKELEQLGDGDVGALHRTRVASRRLRELLPLLALPRESSRDLTRRLRRVTKRLGKVRELDVQIGLIKELRAARQCSQPGLQQLRAAAAAARSAARQHLSQKLPVEKLERLSRKLSRMSESVESSATGSRVKAVPRRDREVVWALEARVAHRAARASAKIEEAGALYVPERLHDVRLAVKKLRYAAELLAEVTRRRIATDIAALKAAQDLLGRLHDLEVLLVRTREAQADVPLTDVVKWRNMDSVVRVLEDQNRQLHARYMRDRSGLLAVTHRLGANVPGSQPAARSAVG